MMQTSLGIDNGRKSTSAANLDLQRMVSTSFTLPSLSASAIDTYILPAFPVRFSSLPVRCDADELQLGVSFAT